MATVIGDGGGRPIGDGPGPGPAVPSAGEATLAGTSAAAPAVGNGMAMNVEQTSSLMKQVIQTGETFHTDFRSSMRQIGDLLQQLGNDENGRNFREGIDPAVEQLDWLGDLLGRDVKGAGEVGDAATRAYERANEVAAQTIRSTGPTR
ncbi:hypothetical protein [Plantactinospora sp. CA-290183]|uniref:hypothetical protein n=1 Tax=Plantactinospora sp. CA-290183 TaxID=3240006 RepID=UPI003D8B1EA2